MTDQFKIHPQPEYDALHAFDQENDVQPARTLAERIGSKYRIRWDNPLIDDISHAIEDARDLGVRRGPLIPLSRS